MSDRRIPVGISLCLLGQEDRLHNARLLEDFITRVFAYDLWQSLREQRLLNPKE